MNFYKYSYFAFIAVLLLCLLVEPSEAGFRKKFNKLVKKVKHTIHQAAGVAGDAAAVAAGGAAVGAVVG